MRTPLLIAAACLLCLLSTAGSSLPYPLLPPLFADGSGDLARFMGLPPKLLFSLALAINPLGLLIGSALLGPLSDRFGRRPVLMATAIGAAVGHALTAVALLAESYPGFILARFLTGLLEGNVAVVRAMLADRLDGSLRARALSCLNCAFYTGWLAGPLLGAYTAQWGLSTPFWLAAFTLLLAALMIAVSLPAETMRRSAAGWLQAARESHAMNLLRIAAVRQVFIVHLIYTCGLAAFYQFAPLWLVEVAHYSSPQIANVTAILCCVLVLASLCAGGVKPAAALSRLRWYAAGSALAIACVALGNRELGLAAIILCGIPNASHNTVMQIWAAQRFAGYGQGAVMGLLMCTVCIANIVMALVGSVLSLVDTRLILVTGAALAAVAAWRLPALNQTAREEICLPATQM